MTVPSPCLIGKDEQMAGKVQCACGRWFTPDATRKKFCDRACYSASIRVPIEQRFWTKVKVGEPDDCWLWTAATIKGYGQIAGTLHGKKRPLYAHRVAWELTHGPILNDLEVLHRCDVPLCVNPSHLFLGTQQENLADARAKGRLDTSGPRTHILSYAERLAIFESRGVKGVTLARHYGVSKTCISLIRKGRFAREALNNVEPVRCVAVPVRGELHASHRLATTSMPVSPVLGNQIGAVR